MIPPTLGSCYLELGDNQLAQLDDLVEFVEARGGRFVHRHRAGGDAKAEMIKAAERYGYRSPVVSGMYLVEIAEDDLILTEFALMFD